MKLKNLQIIFFVIIGISLISLIYFGFMQFQTYRIKKLIFSKNTPNYDLRVNLNIKISGVWDCLPPDFTTEDGLNCAKGIKDNDGNYFLLFYPKAGMVQATEKAGVVSFTGVPKSTTITSDGKKVNFFYVSKIN